MLIYTETVGGILKNVGNCVQPGRPREQAATAIYQSVSRYIIGKRGISQGKSCKDLGKSRKDWGISRELDLFYKRIIV